MNATSLTRRLMLTFTGSWLAKPGWAEAVQASEQAASLTADEILQRMVAAYATCRSYRDSGSVTTLSLHGEHQSSETLTFDTVFIRPANFRFEFRRAGLNRDSSRYLVCADDTGIRSWWDLKPGVKPEPSLNMALAGPTGISRGSAHTVPRLLMPDTISGFKLTALVELERLDDAKLGDADCFCVRGTHPPIDPAILEVGRQRSIQVTGRDPGIAERSPATIWIDKSTFLLRRIDEQTQFPDFRTEQTTAYTPQFDVAINAEQLRFDPPAS